MTQRAHLERRLRLPPTVLARREEPMLCMLPAPGDRGTCPSPPPPCAPPVLEPRPLSTSMAIERCDTCAQAECCLMVKGIKRSGSPDGLADRP